MAIPHKLGSICPAPASRIRQQCILRLHASRWPGAEPGIPARSAGLLRDEEKGRNAPIQGCRPREGRLPAEGGRLRWTSLHRNPPRHGMGRAAANSTGLIQGGP